MESLPLRLVRRTPHSYTASDVPALADWLETHGYAPLASRSLVEYGRYQRGASLIVCYHSGSIVLQGADVESARQLLRQLVADVPTGATYDPAHDWTAEGEVAR